MPSRSRYLLGLGLLVSAGKLHAQEPTSPIEVHGYGSWAYGRTNHNVLLGGTPAGDYRSTAMSLNLSKRVDDNLSIHAQGGITEDDDNTHVALSYAFAEYKLNDRIAFRVGQVKHPFGIYTEVFAVGTLRPFIDLPQAFYGPVGFAGQSYKGVGLTGHEDLGSWNVKYDLYAGGNDLQKNAVPEQFFKGNNLQNVDEEIENQSTRNVTGGRVRIQTPIDGLSFGSSAYTGTLDEPAANRRTVVAGQIGYRSDALTLESEWAHEEQVNDERATGGYLLAAYRLKPEWQVAAQYDDLTNRFFGADVAAAESLERHREGAVAISRWISRAFVVKAEYHLVSGNRFALPHPEDLVATVAARQLHTVTQLVQFGAQFSF